MSARGRLGAAAVIRRRAPRKPPPIRRPHPGRRPAAAHAPNPGQAERVEKRLGRHGAGEPRRHHQLDEWRGALLEAGGHGGVARLERVQDRPELGRDDVRDRAHVPRRAHRVQREDVLVAARVVRQVGAAQHLLGPEEVVGAVLDRDDPGVLGEPDQGLRFDTGAGAARDVVEHEGQPRGVGDLAEVRLQGVLRRPAVVRRDHQHPVRARLFGLPGEFDGVPGVERPHPRHDRHPLPDGLPHGRDERRLLRVRRRRRLPGRPGQHQPVTPLRHQPHGKELSPGKIKRPRLAEGVTMAHRARPKGVGRRGPESSWE